MLRKLVIVFGVVEALFPDQVVAAVTRLGYRTEGKTEPRSWLVSAARAEGVMLAIAGTVGLLAHRYGRKKAEVEETVEDVEETVEDVAEEIEIETEAEE